MKPSIYGLTRKALLEWTLEQGEKKFRATQFGSGSINSVLEHLKK